jgi:hypothetical protein
MIAQRVIYYFRDLLDIKASRAAAAWLRLNTDGTVSERTAAQTLGDLGAVPYTGATSALDMGEHPIFTQALHVEGLLQIEDETAINISPVTRGNFWTGLGGLGTITAPTFTSPLPITSGGTGGDTAGAARIALGVGSEQAVQFGQISTNAQPLRIPLVYSNSADFPTASTAFQNVTGLSFPVLANKNYQISYFFVTNKTDSNGLQVMFTGPSTPTKVFLRHQSSLTTLTSVATEIVTAFSQTTSTCNNVNADGFILSLPGGMISNGPNAGTVQLQIRAITGGTAKIYAGSWIQVTQLN